MAVSIERGTGRPEGGYTKLAGFDIPSVTDVLDIVGEKEGLCRHFAQLGMFGFIDRDRKAEVGHRVHAAAEATIHGGAREAQLGESLQQHIDRLLEPPLEEDPLAAKDRDDESQERRRAEMAQWSWAAYGAWLEWWSVASFDLEPIATETPLVHREYRITKNAERSRLPYAGTPDLVAWYTPRPGERLRVIVDWKTSEQLYPEAAAQVGAYGVAWNAERGEAVDGAILVRAGRDGVLSTLFLEGPAWGAAKAMWASARALYAYRGVLSTRTDQENARAAKAREAAKAA
ncbi:MAG: PD-(D/E)XK nuclease family protein [Myxococcota bacterium]